MVIWIIWILDSKFLEDTTFRKLKIKYLPCLTAIM